MLPEVFKLCMSLTKRILKLRRFHGLISQRYIPNLRVEGDERGREGVVGQDLRSIFIWKDIQEVFDKKRVVKEALKTRVHETRVA